VGLDDLILPFVTGGAIAGVAAGIAWAAYARLCLRVPPNRAAVLYGRRTPSSDKELGGPAVAEIRHPRIVVGGRAFLAPWDRGVGFLSLQPFTVDVTVRSLDSLAASRASGWEVRLTAQAKIPSDPELLRVAAENLLGKSDEEVRALLRHAVEATVPSVLARLCPPGAEADWERVASEVQASVAPELVACGLVVRSLSVTALVRIQPSVDPSPPPVAARAPAALPAPATADPTDLSLELRVSRVERSLGIIGAEIVRVVHEGLPSREGRDASSVLDYPLGFEGPLSMAGLDAGAGSLHGPMGGERSPRARLPVPEDPEAEVGGSHRSLMDVERGR
jgi:hypothetical protein